MEPSIAFAGILGLAAHPFGERLCLRAAPDRAGTHASEAHRTRPYRRRARTRWPGRRTRSADLRRGLLLIAVGLAWSIVTFFVGGKAWMAGIVPVMLGRDVRAVQGSGCPIALMRARRKPSGSARVVVHDDHEAFAELVRLHQSAIRQFLRRLTRHDWGRADDLAQETFWRAYRHIATYEARGRFLSWLFRIA